MIKIGILPTTQINETDSPFSNIYNFPNLISKRISEVGAIPVGILLNDQKLNYNSLKMCDAFIIPGGNKIEPYFIETINYAIQNNVPLLGICCGMQSIGFYSYLEKLLKECNKELTVSNFLEKFKEVIEKKDNFLLPIENHYNEKITRSNYSKNMHPIKLNKNSILYNIYDKSEFDVISLHKYAVNKYGNNVLISCKLEDTIEGIEYKDENLFILGVQWHPELDEKHNVLFKRLVNEAQKRKLK